VLDYYCGVDVLSRPLSLDVYFLIEIEGAQAMDRRLQNLAGKLRLDFLDYLGPNDSPFGQGQFVISAEFKASKKAIEAEVLVTGFIRGPESQSPYQAYLLPLLSFQLPVVARLVTSERFSDYASGLSELALLAEQTLERLYGPIYELAQASQKAGGLRSVRIASSELSIDRTGAGDLDIRSMRQDRRFEIARAHVQAHLATQELPGNAEPIKVGKQSVISVEEFRFANLYSLARAIGVKEIAPRILSEQVEEAELQQKLESPSDFTVLVARLKRAGVIPE
jgi:hypothetical protein